MYINNREVKNTAKIRLRNLIQPTFVRKSYLYRGIPPRTKTNKAISKINLKAIIVAFTTGVLKVSKDNTCTKPFIMVEQNQVINSNSPQYIGSDSDI